jgi:hypothetical protein
MTDYERSQAFEVFGSALNMDDVKLSEGGVMTLGGYSRTLPDHIYFETGVLQRDLSILIHELGHVWQYQKGASVLGLTCTAIHGDYDYGGEQGLRDGVAHGKPFSDFGYEEQAQILQDYYRASNTAAFDPYIHSVRHGTHHQAAASAYADQLPRCDGTWPNRTTSVVRSGSASTSIPRSNVATRAWRRRTSDNRWASVTCACEMSRTSGTSGEAARDTSSTQNS